MFQTIHSVTIFIEDNQSGSKLTKSSKNCFVWNTELLRHEHQEKQIGKPYFRRVAMSMSVAGQSWEDPTPSEWPENDYCLLCGNLGNEVNDDVLSKVFSRIPTFNKAKVVRNKQTGKTRGYGFVSFSNSLDRAAALTEMNGKYVGNRPIILHKSKSRTDYEALKRRRARTSTQIYIQIYLVHFLSPVLDRSPFFRIFNHNNSQIPNKAIGKSQFTGVAMSSVPSTSAAATSSSSQFTYSNGTYFPTPFHLQQQPPQPYIGAAPPPVQLPAPSLYPAPASIPGVYTLPQFQQAQQLFQRDAQTITPEALENVKAALASSEIEHKAEAKKKSVPRKAAGHSWEDPTLAEWPENDYRLFCGDLGNEVNDDVLSKAFSRFPTFNMAKDKKLYSSSCHRSDNLLLLSGIESHRCLIPDLALMEANSKRDQVVRDKRTGKTRGYGFVSFSNPLDLAAALKEMNGKYVGNRPIKLRKSKWQERIDYEAVESHKNRSHKKPKQAKKGIFHK
ncbi:hypothetical protein H5410_020159 [Solanum commersonii]|uniref:RRM domain-containing protein n=1 Tax=Solanum commersonii TaxID=4109 RepID=A0A9J5ZDC5_SOLCO|nr:hypothetical protein H5410_020159 [Solanum commersonii]